MTTVSYRVKQHLLTLPLNSVFDAGQITRAMSEDRNAVGAALRTAERKGWLRLVGRTETARNANLYMLVTTAPEWPHQPYLQKGPRQKRAFRPKPKRMPPRIPRLADKRLADCTRQELDAWITSLGNA